MVWLKNYFIWFVLYSAAGWVWEVAFCSSRAGRLINRGFLCGPYCPIYGVGALLVIWLLSGIEHPLLLFLAGALLTCLLEYFTSWVMEELFRTRWWDYSDKPLNLNGRVYLRGALAFGLLSVAVVKLVHAPVAAYTAQLPEPVASWIAVGLFALMLTDALYTVLRLSALWAGPRAPAQTQGGALSTTGGQTSGQPQGLEP
ncbi:MAG: putative ABC transporter permease [Clostridiales bacterium]|nr:putative ABC transporter permease [Clostridiales bacterium]